MHVPRLVIEEARLFPLNGIEFVDDYEQNPV